MILGFKTHIKGEPTYFFQKILACVISEYAKIFFPKKHSIRKGKRWKAGMPIHMATGVRTKDYFQFNKGIRGLEKVISVQDIEIKYLDKEGIPLSEYNCLRKDYVGKYITVLVDYKTLKKHAVEVLAVNEGFDNIEAFLSWFNEDFEGQIIHWMDLRY